MAASGAPGRDEFHLVPFHSQEERRRHINWGKVKLAPPTGSVFTSPMQLSLSVRIVEAACKTRLQVVFEELVGIAADTGYQAVCMRASAGGVPTWSSNISA